MKLDDNKQFISCKQSKWKISVREHTAYNYTNLLNSHIVLELKKLPNSKNC